MSCINASTDSKHETFFNQLYHDYKKLRKLLDEDSKNDPENEPYRSKYMAKVVLYTMLNNYKNIAQDLPETCRIRGLAAHSTILLHLGIVGIDTEELDEGERFLSKCMDLLMPHPFEPELVMILLNAYNQMGILWSNRNDITKSKLFLMRAALLYKEFKELNLTPLEFFDIFKPPDEELISEAILNLEKAYTLTLYYLAQLYGSMKEHLKSAVYCHTTLKRQLKFNDYEPIDWALNAATLSQFFMEKNGFKQSKHHLAAASYIMDKYKNDTVNKNDATDAGKALSEQIDHRSADISRCWSKYCIGLLSASKDRLMDDSNNSLPNSLSLEFEKLQLDEENHLPSLDYDKLIFDELPITNIENQITNEFVLTFDDARAVFLNCQKWIDSAKEYYTLESHASDYVEVIQDRSTLYRLLAFYEEDERRQCAMHKRRTDMLEELVGALNPDYYGDFCRQIWFELGETYSDVLDIKLDKLKNMSPSERPTPSMLGKINHIVDESIKNFKCFIDSLKDKTTKEIPNNMRIEVLRPVLLAFFHLGRLHVKYVVLDKNIQLKNTEESLACYKKFVESCEADEIAGELMRAELGVCREMITLLPYKVIKLQKEIRDS